MARFDPAPIIPRWFVISTVVICLVPALTFLVNHPGVQRPILQELKAETGFEVSAVRVHLFPRLTIECTELSLLDEQDGSTIFHSRHGSLTLRVLPLLKKRLAIVRAVMEEPRVVVRRDGQGKWLIPFAGRTQSSPSGGEGNFTWEWLLPDLQMTDGEILFLDEYGGEVRKTRIRNLTALIDSHLLRREADIFLTGDTDEGGIHLSGSLSLTPSASSSVPTQEAVLPVRFEGSMRVDRFDIARWLDHSNALDSNKERPRRVDVMGHALILAGAEGYDATFSDVETHLDWLVVRGQGRIHVMGTEAPIYSATVSTSPVDLETAVQRLPLAWIPAKVRAALVEYALGGTFELVSATLGGRLDQPEQLDWKGVAKLSQGHGVFGTERIPLHHLSSTLFFDPMHFEAMNLSGGFGALELSDGRLAIVHLDLAPELDLQLTGTGKTREILGLIQAFGRASKSVTALDALTNPKGDVRLSVHVGGPLMPDPQVKLIKAEITGDDLGVRLPEWNLIAEHLNGTVGVTPRFVELQHLRGRVGPIEFDIQGAVEMSQTPRLEDVTVELSAGGFELMQFISKHLSVATDIVLDGPTRARIQISGPARWPKWKTRVDLAEAEVRVPPLVEKRRNVVSSLVFEGGTLKDKRLAIERIEFRLPSAVVKGRAELRLGKQREFNAHVATEPVSLTSLADGFVIGPSMEGVLQASVSITGRGPEWTQWKTSGWVQLTGGAVRVEGLQDKLRGVSCRMLLDKRDVMIERLAFKVGDSDVRVRGIIKRWLNRPRATLTLESSKLDVTRLIPVDHGAEQKSPTMLDQMREWTMFGHADVTAIVKEAYYRNLRFQTLSGRVTIGAGKMELTRLIGETPQGMLSGRVDVSLSPQKPITIVVEMDMTGMPVHQLLSVIDPGVERVRGLLSLKGRMTAAVQPSYPFLGTVQTLAPFTMRINKGRVTQGTVLPKVLKMLNLPALLKERVDLDRDGIPFDALSATVTVKKGVLLSNDIVFDSPVVKISGAGTFDMTADELDLALAVSPFGAYSDLIGNIPLFGTLLAGDRPGLSTALFEVKGPRSDPDIRYLPIESIAKGLTGYPRLAIDVLINTISLPQKLLAPSESE